MILLIKHIKFTINVILLLHTITIIRKYSEKINYNLPKLEN